MKYWINIIFLISIIGCQSHTSDELYKKYNIFKISHIDAPGIVMITTGFGKSELCTGVAISRNSVLTAAHCLYFPKDVLNIKYNCDNIKNKCESAKIYNIITHPEPLVNDLAIIKTAQLNNINVAKFSDFPVIPDILLLSGYGSKPHGSRGELFGVISQQIEYTDWSDYFYVRMSPGEGLCFGDSGGPAYNFANNELVGILSTSSVNIKYYKCGGLLKYMYIPNYFKWIMKNR